MLLGQIDYELTQSLEEWVGGTYRIDEEFRRLVIHTEKAQKAIWHLFGKMVPLNAVIKLTEDDMKELRTIFWHNSGCKMIGTYGPYRVKSFTVMAFYGNEDAVATEDELKYDYEWPDLFGLA